MTRPYDSSDLIDTQIAAANRSVDRLKRFDRAAKEHLEQHQRCCPRSKGKRATRAPA